MRRGGSERQHIKTSLERKLTEEDESKIYQVTEQSAHLLLPRVALRDWNLQATHFPETRENH